MRVAVYGGSFDPPHLAHQRAVQLVSADPEIDRVLVVPVYEHAFDKALAAFEHRLKMCELCMSGPTVEISPIESELEPPNYTLHTLRALLDRNPEFRPRLVVGADVLQDVQKWHRFDEVKRLAPLYPLGRVGVQCSAAPAPELPDVSSSQIRAVLQGRGCQRLGLEDRLRLLQWLDPATLEYIEQNGLYR